LVVREAVAVSLRVVLMAVDSFSTLKWAILKFLRRSSNGRRRRGWSWGSVSLRWEGGQRAYENEVSVWV
jgi:hypothetical protein